MRTMTKTLIFNASLALLGASNLALADTATGEPALDHEQLQAQARERQAEARQFGDQMQTRAREHGQEMETAGRDMGQQMQNRELTAEQRQEMAREHGQQMQTRAREFGAEMETAGRDMGQRMQTRGRDQAGMARQQAGRMGQRPAGMNRGAARPAGFGAGRPMVRR